MAVAVVEVALAREILPAAIEVTGLFRTTDPPVPVVGLPPGPAIKKLLALGVETVHVALKAALLLPEIVTDCPAV